MHITFGPVVVADRDRAFEWHLALTLTGGVIRLLPRDGFQRLCAERRIWVAMRDDGAILGMIYLQFSEQDRWNELSGFIVAPDHRGRGIGGILSHLLLADLLVNECNFSSPPATPIVTHVVATNAAPRGIFATMGFIFAQRLEFPASVFPTLRSDPDGLVRGDEFHLQRAVAAKCLASWCAGWTGMLADGTTMTVRHREGASMATMEAALRAMSSEPPEPALRTLECGVPA